MDYLERTLSFLFTSCRNFDKDLFTRSPTFLSTPPTLTITSPDCGPSTSTLPVQYTADIQPPTIPTLTWTLPSTIVPPSKIASYILICQDADSPLGAILHGSYYNIPPTTTSITNADYEPDLSDTKPRKNLCRGGFRFGRNLRGIVYGAPRPLKGHGVHRYFWQVIALGEGEEGKGELLSEFPKYAELARFCEGRVLAWGEWVGCCERN